MYQSLTLFAFPLRGDGGPSATSAARARTCRQLFIDRATNPITTKANAAKNNLERPDIGADDPDDPLAGGANAAVTELISFRDPVFAASIERSV